MNNIFAILKKELRRFFTDKRMLLSLFLPGILIFIIYTAMGSVFSNFLNPSDDYNYIVYIDNPVEEFNVINTSSHYKIEIKNFNNLSNEEKENYKNDIKNEKIDLLICFESDFYNKLNNGEKPNVEIYYLSTSTASSTIYNYYFQTLNNNSMTINYNYYVNQNNDINYDLSTDEDKSKVIITMVLPFILVIMLFTGCMNVTTESIAGEKERGTIATLLVTPVKRSEIALGKILALSVTSIVSSITSFLGLALSLPKLLQGTGDITLSMYGISTYIYVLLIIIVITILFTTLLSIVSCFSKSIKEANQYATPLMFLIMAISGSTYFISNNNWYLYLIPIFNSINCLSEIFSLNFNLVNFLITIISNIVYISLGVFVVTKMFDNEKVMFN
ncbi:MAG: ABC transporter permease [Bacilli bacterium]